MVISVELTVVALTVVPLIVVIPEILPPVKATAAAFITARSPKPKLVLAPAAVLAPVPPSSIAQGLAVLSISLVIELKSSKYTFPSAPILMNCPAVPAAVGIKTPETLACPTTVKLPLIVISLFTVERKERTSLLYSKVTLST